MLCILELSFNQAIGPSGAFNTRLEVTRAEVICHKKLKPAPAAQACSMEHAIAGLAASPPPLPQRASHNLAHPALLGFRLLLQKGVKGRGLPSTA